MSICRLALVALVIAGCGKPEPDITLSGETMGTTYSVKVAMVSAPLDERALKRDIDAVLRAVNSSMSTYDETSELSRLNQNRTTEWIPISPELYEVLFAALGVSKLSGGAFDVTVGPLVNLWGFGPQNVPIRVPSDQALARERRRVGYEKVSLRAEGPAVRKSLGDVYIDLSGIAKGYAVDRISALLGARGLDNHMVEIGGEVKARGFNANGIPWQIGIEKPDVERRSIFDILSLSEMGMASSGDYRNYFEQNGRRYSHTIDPGTGSPVVHRLVAVTVLDGSTMRADALATALLVLGPQDGYGLAARENIAALFLIRQDDGFEARVTPVFARVVGGSGLD